MNKKHIKGYISVLPKETIIRYERNTNSESGFFGYTVDGKVLQLYMLQWLLHTRRQEMVGDLIEFYYYPVTIKQRSQNTLFPIKTDGKERKDTKDAGHPRSDSQRRKLEMRSRNDRILHKGSQPKVGNQSHVRSDIHFVCLEPRWLWQADVCPSDDSRSWVDVSERQCVEAK